MVGGFSKLVIPTPAQSIKETMGQHQMEKEEEGNSNRQHLDASRVGFFF